MKKHVVITGASSGIGYEAAKRFAQRGKNIVAVARNEEKLAKLKAEITGMVNPPVEVIIKTYDLTQKENIYAVYNSVKDLDIEAWINNAGFGDYCSVGNQNLAKMEDMLSLNIEAVALFSALYVRDFADKEHTQLINVSSVGGYTIVPTAVTYCATKFFVASFTEGLSHELSAAGAKMKAKVFAPAATKTNFGNIANDITNYDYDKAFGKYHSCKQAVDFLMQLYDSDKPLGIVNRETFEFSLSDYRFPYVQKPQTLQRV